ncbi:uncharacterized protein LOC113052750 [Carassius auratus]|uniref:Uncharacterized protein LOC113052750 n=1 Tax=Carassius auratus TaxID=7957 RepID=A0A6P6KP89_CARAU|nr:uncharacterized protein LOC113052750 [Carassius auratus]
MQPFFQLIIAIASFTLTAAVSDSERVEVKSGETLTLRVQTPGNVSRATLTLLKKSENRTEEPITLYCSPEEEERGCSVKKSDRFSITSDTESLSLIFGDVRVSDEGCYTVSYIDNFNIWTEKLFEVTVNGSLETPHKPKETPGNSLEHWIIIAVSIALSASVILGIIYVIKRIINRRKKKLKTRGDPEEIISLSSAGAASKPTTDESLEMGDVTKSSVDNNKQRSKKDLNHGA